MEGATGDKRTLTVITIVLAAATFVSGTVGGWVGSQSSIARLEARVESLEKKNESDDKKLEYIRAQGEATGRDVAAVKAIIMQDERRRQR